MKHVTGRTIFKAIFSVLGLASAVTAPAAFADEKVYPGAQCRPYYSFAEGTNNADNVAIWNKNPLEGDGLYVVCPIVRDNISNTNGTRSARIAIYNTRVFRGDVGCTLWSSDRFGQGIDAKAVYAKYKGYEELEVDVNTSVLGGTYALTCYLPPESAILSYRVDEY